MLLDVCPENGFVFNGMSQFVTSQNFQNVTGKSRLAQPFWCFLHVYVTSNLLLSHMRDTIFVSEVCGKRNHHLKQHEITVNPTKH